jgi:predicted nucleotidyltransferase
MAGQLLKAGKDSMDLDRITQALSIVGGVTAVVLGGSHSRGEAAAHSDYDPGVYYGKDELDTVALERRLEELDDGRREDLPNPTGEWGPWINGGAWLIVEGVCSKLICRSAISM